MFLENLSWENYVETFVPSAILTSIKHQVCIVPVYLQTAKLTKVNQKSDTTMDMVRSLMVKDYTIEFPDEFHDFAFGMIAIYEDDADDEVSIYAIANFSDIIPPPVWALAQLCDTHVPSDHPEWEPENTDNPGAHIMFTAIKEIYPQVREKFKELNTFLSKDDNA